MAGVIRLPQPLPKSGSDKAQLGRNWDAIGAQLGLIWGRDSVEVQVGIGLRLEGWTRPKSAGIGRNRLESAEISGMTCQRLPLGPPQALNRPIPCATKRKHELVVVGLRLSTLKV